MREVKKGGIAPKKTKKKLKRWQITLIVILCLLLVVGGLAFAYIYNKVDKIKKVDLDATSDELSCVDVDGYVNILLLGADSRDMENYKGSRTDVMMILSLKEETNEVRLISVYRDTYLKLGNKDKYGKINSAFFFGGPKDSVISLNQAMDLNIDKYVLFNFKTVADLVDEVGGIEVDITTNAEVQQLNKYTIETANILGVKNYKTVPGIGKYNLQGVQAVSYGRIRKGVGDDFKRAERTREVITKVVEKLKSQKVSKLNKVLDKILPQIQTNLDNSDILALGTRLPKVKFKDSLGFPLNVQGVTLRDGSSNVFPVNLKNDVIELHKNVFKQENYVPSKSVEQISNHLIEVANSSKGTTSLPNAPKPNTQITKQPTQPVVKPTQPTGGTHTGGSTNTGGSTHTGGSTNTGGSTTGGNSNTGGNTNTGGSNTGTSGGNTSGGGSTGGSVPTNPPSGGAGGTSGGSQDGGTQDGGR